MASNAIKTTMAAAIETAAIRGGGAAQFTSRSTFALPSNLPRSYFLGHHKAGLDRMKAMLSQIDLVIECRDYRIPYTSRNQLLEQSLSERERAIVYTKWDLGVESTRVIEAKKRDELLRRDHRPSVVHFSSTSTSARSRQSKSVQPILEHLKEFARTHFSLTGHRVLIAGMPNVGKSTLLNSLRAAGVHKGKAARTGAQPGITRSIATSVRILDGAAIDGGGASATSSSSTSAGQREQAAASSEGVFIVDTPGVFMPYVPDGEAMLKLALCGCVKDGLLPPITVADYLLFHLNLHDCNVYSEFANPTNEVLELLEGVARRTGKLSRGAELDLETAAAWIIQRWRKGLLGRFVLDDVSSLVAQGTSETSAATDAVSVSQAKKLYKAARKEKIKGSARGI